MILWILLLQSLDLLSYTCSYWVSHFMMSLWQYNWDIKWRCVQSNLYYENKMMFLTIHLFQMVLTYISGRKGQECTQVRMFYLPMQCVDKIVEIMIFFWSDTTYVQSILLKTTFWIEQEPSMIILLCRFHNTVVTITIEQTSSGFLFYIRNSYHGNSNAC